MAYIIEVTPQAEEDISRLDKTIAQNIADKIDWLSENIELIIPAPLKGKFKGKYKLRVGDWRIIYSYIINIHLKRLRYMLLDIAVKSIKYDTQLLWHHSVPPNP